MSDFSFGLRALARSPGFTCITVLTLALGISANTALFSVVHAVLLRSFGYADASRIVQIPNVSIPDMRAFQARAHSFQQIGTVRLQTYSLVGSREPENLYGQMVSPDCFAVLGAPPRMGRLFATPDFEAGAQPVVLLSHRVWQSTFEADPQILGRRVVLNGAEHTVIGVMPPEFQLSHPIFGMWTPWRFTPEELANRRQHSYTLFARLRPGVTREAAQAELHSLSQALAFEFPETNKNWQGILEPVNERFLGGLRPVLYTLLGAVGLVLLIACMNVANLLMARGAARSREMSIRTAIGATRLRLVRQLLVESLIIAGLGGVVGVFLARCWLWLLIALLPARTIPVLPGADQAGLNSRVLLVCLTATVAAGVMFGLFPALRVSASATRAGTTVTRSRFHLALIFLETALSIVLLAGAGLLLRSFDNMLRTDPGFRPEHVLTVQIPSEWQGIAQPNDPAASERRRQYFRDILSRVQSLPGVTAAGLSTVLPLGAVQFQTRIYLQGRPENELRPAYRAVSPEYFQTMGIPLLRGRTFNGDDRAGRPAAVIVSEAFARRYWPDEDAVGRQLTLGDPRTGPWSTVVGVVGSVRFARLTIQPDPELYTSYAQTLLAAQVSAIVLRTSRDPAELAPAVRDTIHQINPKQPVTDVKTMTQAVSDSMAQPRLYTVLLVIFAGLALALAAAGIFSVIAWTVSNGTREIGIRMALGAAPRHVLRNTMTRALAASAAGSVAGLAGAAALTKFLKTQLYGVTATDPATFAGVPILLIAIAAVAAYIPARRALRIDPMTALRTE